MEETTSEDRVTKYLRWAIFAISIYLMLVDTDFPIRAWFHRTVMLSSWWASTLFTNIAVDAYSKYQEEVDHG